MLNKIFISQNRAKIVEDLQKEFLNIKLFIRDEFKIDDALDVINEAYISESIHKYLILSANNYNIYAQNRLLKILEESPRNVTFFIVGTSKNIFLPTILSRMIIEYKNEKKSYYNLEIDLVKLDLKIIFEFVKKNRFISKEELKTIIEDLLKESLKNDIELNQDDLDNFKISMELASFNSKPHYILTNLLLGIYEQKEKIKTIN